MHPVRVFIRILRRSWVSAFQHHEWIKRLPPAEILRFQTRGAREVVSPVHGRSRKVRRRWNWNRGAGHPAAGAGDAPVLSQPPPQGPGGAETGSVESSPCTHPWWHHRLCQTFCLLICFLDPHRLAGQEGGQALSKAGERSRPQCLLSPQTKEAEVGGQRWPRPRSRSWETQIQKPAA